MGVYLDHASTTIMAPIALQAFTEAAQLVGNPSSMHLFGRQARRIEDARESIAADLGAHPSEIVFTPGGTAANNLAVKGLFFAATARDRARRRIEISAIEHHSVLEPAAWLERTSGATVSQLPAARDGTVVAPTSSIDGKLAMASVMLANNEIGTIQPIPVIAEVYRTAEIPFHTDAIAAVGHVEVNFAELGVDAMSVASHKVGGPGGIGALIVKRETVIEGLIHGGGQERGLIAGTVSAPLAAGFAAALRSAVAGIERETERILHHRDLLINGVITSVPGAQLTGAVDARLPGLASFVFPGSDPDALLFGLDNAGFAASIGAACSAGVMAPSHVLLACGYDSQTASTGLRFSLSAQTTENDVNAVTEAIPNVVANASKLFG